MKIIFSLLVVFTLFNSCSAQMMKSINDVSKIKKNENDFLEKPLSLLLSEIKPEIKLFFADKGSDVRPGVISFYFINYEQFSKLRETKKRATKITVSVTGTVATNDYSLPLEQRFVWTKEYKELNKNLIVTRILITEAEN